MGWLSGWTYRKKIAIDHTKIDASLTDFPVLVRLTSSNFDFTKARSDGYDIRFTSSDGTTLLKYERERHDSANSVAEYWVKIPSVSNTADTIFYIYFGNASASDGADPTNVWDANFKAVWHLKDNTTSQILDSTSNGYTGTKKAANEPAEADGKIAKGQNFDGVDDYIAISGDLGSPASFTFEALFKLDTLPGAGKYYGIYGNQGWTVNGKVHIQVLPSDHSTDPNKVQFAVYPETTYLTSTTIPSTGTWYYLACVRQASGTWALYLNAVSERSATANSYGVALSTTTRLGNTYDNTRILDGMLDEVRISDVVRSAAWIKATYYSNFNSLVSYGALETLNLGAMLLMFLS